MILLIGVVAGLAGGILRAAINKRPYQPYLLRCTWLVIIAIAAQWFTFSFPLTRASIPIILVRLILVLSQLTLLAFAVENRNSPGFWLLGAGLLLNLLVITLNGGLMPISPEAVQWLIPESTTWQIGERLGFGKDIVLPRGQTIFWILSDRFRTPMWWPTKVAFSLGDVFIALGAFWLFWSIGGKRRDLNLEEKSNVSTILSTFK